MVSPLPLDLGFLDLVSAEKFCKVFVIADQHQFFKLAAGVLEARDLFSGADAGANNGNFSLLS